MKSNGLILLTQRITIIITECVLHGLDYRYI
jgi:hypothetical protein